MSKKLITLISTLFLLGNIGITYAGDMTVDVYENGNNVGTMTIPDHQFPNVVDRMRGTGVTLRPQPRPDAAERQQAAQRRMDEWNRQAEQRRIAAQAQQEQWKRQFEERHTAAVQRVEEWKRQNEQRHQAAVAQQEQWNKQFEQRHAAALQGYDAWKASR